MKYILIGLSCTYVVMYICLGILIVQEYMAEKDVVWEHGENKHPGFWCKYYHKEKKGGGATRFKEHLAGRGRQVVHCDHVPVEVRDYFRRELDRIQGRKNSIAEEKYRKEHATSQID